MTTQATITKNGPIKVEGDFKILDAAGMAFTNSEGKPMYLCRCGLSANKPFCDGSHSKQGFQSDVKAV